MARNVLKDHPGIIATGGTMEEVGTTRNIPGINRQLAAIQNGAEAPVLQLPNLHGDIIAKAYLSETATSLASTADTSEFGVPTTSLPSKYSWLGAGEIPTELPSGIMDMGARSYVPQLGRFLQPDPRPAGSANSYTYTFDDPVNTFDPTGEYTATPTWAIEFNNQQAHAATEAYEAAIRRAAEEAAAKIAAERTAREAAWAAALAGPIFGGEEGGGGEEEWYEEEWEEEGGYEEIAYRHGEEESHIDSAVLVEPLTNEEGGATTTFGSPTPLCEPGQKAPCARFAYRNGPHRRSRPYNNGEKSGSRCVQYGGHWQGHTCVGVRSPSGEDGNSCRMIGGVTAPLAACVIAQRNPPIRRTLRSRASSLYAIRQLVG